MKNILIVSILSVLAAISVEAQGTVIFSNNNNTKISTNAVNGGSATGVTIAVPHCYFYALYYSKIASTVNGQTTAILGNSSVNYAFNSSDWTLVAYGTNTLAGRFNSANADSAGNTVVPGLDGGTPAYFVVIGWSANIGTNIAAVQNWFGLGDPNFSGWIGQSAVSGAITPGDSAGTLSPPLFGSSAPYIQGFTLGMAGWGAPPSTPPYITLQPTNVTATVGATARFSAYASGYPTPAYQWKFNGSNILGATSQTLTLSNVQLTNTGSYSALIWNTAGSTNSDAATLTAQTVAGTPPTIVGQPLGGTVPAGTRVMFTATVDGSLPLSYQWSFNNNNLAGETNAWLTLFNVQTNNAGSYAVVITNWYGATNSDPAVLSVQSSPPIIFGQPQSLLLPAGHIAAFTVGAMGSAPLSYQWSFNNTNIDGATNASFELASVQATNAGSYAVIVSNAFGTTNSSAATLAVTAAQYAGYVIFANNNVSATKIYTNSATDGPATGLTATAGQYRFALYASANATSINGRMSAILGKDSIDYAFNDNAWTLVAYGTNVAFRGRLLGANMDDYGQTPVYGFAGGTTVQFVVIGWSSNIGTDIASVQTWFNLGNPLSDGWIGQSAVSGPLLLGDGAIIPAMPLFGASTPRLQGFTLGLASPAIFASYAVPYAPPALMQATVTGNSLKISWPTASGSFGVQTADSPAGPWSDTSLTATADGENSVVTVSAAGQRKYFRLVAQ